MSYFRIAAVSIYVLASDVIERIYESPGIYFDPTGTVKISDDYLHVLVPVDISYIKPHIDNLKTVLGTAGFFCQQNELNYSGCHNLLQPLALRLDSIIRDYSAISHLIIDKEKRSAWFAGIGSMFKQVIGIMDEDDAIRYSNAIQALESNDKKLASLMKDNVLMTNKALRSYNETLKIINVNEARLNDVIESFTIGLKNVTEMSSKLYIDSKMTEIYEQLSSSLLTLSFRVDDIVNSIMFTKSHSIHPSVLTPQQLYDELVLNSRNIIENRELPINLNLHNIHTIVDIAQLSCYYIKTKIVFVIRIPLVVRMEYNLFKSIPLPIPHDNVNPDSYAMIIPDCNHVAISKDKTTYICIENLNNCVKAVNLLHICNNLEIHSVQRTPICETELLCKIWNKLPTKCVTKLMHGDIDIWQELKDNRWLFVESKPIKLTIECHSQVSEHKLLGTGLLNLKPHCKASYKNKEFSSKYNLNLTVKPMIPDFNLINDPCCDINKLDLLKLRSEPLKLTDTNLDKLPKIVTKQFMADIDQIINEPRPMLEYNSHYPILSYCILILILIFIFYYLCKKFGKRFANKFEIEPIHPNSPPEEDQEQEEVPLPRIRIIS